MFARRKTRPIKVGGVVVGGGAPVVVQAMTKTDTRDVRATVGPGPPPGEGRRRDRPPGRSRPGGRGGAPGDPETGPVFPSSPTSISTTVWPWPRSKRASTACASIPATSARPRRSARSSGRRGSGGCPSGSASTRARSRRTSWPGPEGPRRRPWSKAPCGHVRLLEDLDFRLIKISLKASDVPRTLEAYRLLAEQVDYPFHAGITEAGRLLAGSVKSSAGLALLLAEGLADTIRVSLTAPPEKEVFVAWQILQALGLRARGATFVSCPTCGRCEVDLMGVAARVEKAVLGSAARR